MKDKKSIEPIKSKIIKILKKHGVVRAGIFGSYARGEQNEKSDIDILVKFDGSLLTLVGIERELKESLGKKVDLLTYKSIHPLLKDRILKDEVKII
ncbi:MAG: nucleotidyltransferase family protein [Nanoarchaeota archaeon]